MQKYMFLFIFLSFFFTALIPTKSSIASSISTVDIASQTPNLNPIGKLWLRGFFNKNSLYESFYIQDYIQNITNLLIQNSQLHTSERVISFLTNDTSFNAFSVPGKIIGINLGVILAANTESELASVLAHEIAHLQQKHFLQQNKNNTNTSSLSLLGIIGGIGLIMSGAGNAGIIAIQGSLGYEQQQMLLHSREYEYEADYVGLEIIQNTNFDQKGFVSMLSFLDKNSNTPKYMEYLLTHPIGSKRVARVSAKVTANNTRTQKNNTTSNFAYIKKSIVVSMLSNQQIKQNLSSENNYKKPKNTLNNINIYEKSLYLYRLKKYTKSAKNIEKMFKRYPRVIPVIVLYAKSLFFSGKKSQALSILKTNLQLNPKSNIFAMELSSLLVSSKKNKEAIGYLKAIEKQNIYNPLYWKLLQQAYLGDKNRLDFLLAQAHSQQLSARFIQAKISLKYAKDLVKNSPLLRIYISSKEKEVADTQRAFKKLFDGN